MSGRELSLRMPLPPEQESAARARCRDRAGRELVSADVRLTSKLSSAPTAEAEVRVQGEQLTLDGAASSANAGTRAPLLEYTWWRVLPGAQPETPLGTGPQLSLPVPKEQGELQFVLRVRDASGKEALAKTAVVVTPEGARPLSPQGPRWIDEAVVYGVIPPLYGQPPLARVTDSLDA
ncbi:MAG: Alpha amylase, catalytic region, partial [Myxococcaceae bacterium]|nr:Alpha amylase, catalytic region [Myxococcaceae bacterium]